MIFKSESVANLAQALSMAQGEIQSAQKDARNPHFNNTFASLKEVRQACQAPLSKHKIAITQIPQFSETEMWLETVLMHASGDWIMSRYPIRPTRNDPQSLGSAITYAKRYAMSAMVGIVADDDDDGNLASAPVARPAPVVNKAAPAGFDPNNKDHMKALKLELDKRNIGRDWAANVIHAMKGKAMAELDAIIVKANPSVADGE